MFNAYNPQMNIDRIDKQIADLERIKSQLQQPTPTNLTQNFQIAPSREFIRWYLDKNYPRVPAIYETVGETAAHYPDEVLLITMNGHITCAKFGIVYDSFDCRYRKTEDAWIVKD